MGTLIVRFFDVLLIIAGAVLAVVGIRSFLANTEEAPTEVSIAAFEKGEKPAAKWLKITDGELYFPAYAKDVKVNQKSGQTSDGHSFYIPLGSREQVRQWLISELGGKPSLKDCRVLVSINRSEVAEKWPELLTDKLPSNPNSLAAVGTVVAGTDASGVLQKYYNQKYRDIDFAQLSVVSHGDKPMQKRDAAMLLGAGTGMVVIGVLIWRIKRHRHRARALAVPQGHPSEPTNPLDPEQGT